MYEIVQGWGCTNNRVSVAVFKGRAEEKESN